MAGLDGADYCGDDGDGYDADDDELEVLLHGRDAAEEVAEQGEQRCPCDAAEDVERDEVVPLHPSHAREERDERPDEWEEPTKEYRELTVCFDCRQAMVSLRMRSMARHFGKTRL